MSALRQLQESDSRRRRAVGVLTCIAVGGVGLLFFSPWARDPKVTDGGVAAEERPVLNSSSDLESREETIPGASGRDDAYRLPIPGSQDVRLGGDDYIFVLECLQKEAAATEKKLNRFYDRHVSGARTALSTADFEHDEAGLLLAVELDHKYVDRFKRGQYRLLFPNEERIQPPIHIRELNIGCIHEGRGATAIIPVDLSAPSIIAAVEQLQAKRQTWLAELAFQFNLKPFDERAAISKRRSSNPRWAKNNFPMEISIDNSSMLASYTPKN